MCKGVWEKLVVMYLCLELLELGLLLGLVCFYLLLGLIAGLSDLLCAVCGVLVIPTGMVAG